MIHSLAGGSFKEKRVEDFALVEIEEGVMKGSKFWYLLPNRDYEVGDKVVVPLGVKNTELKAVIKRIDFAVPFGQTPVPLNSAKYILKKQGCEK